MDNAGQLGADGVSHSRTIDRGGYQSLRGSPGRRCRAPSLRRILATAGVVILAVSQAPVRARAADDSAERAALQAHQATSLHCGEVSQEPGQLAEPAVAEVEAALQQVRAAQQRSSEPYLLFWDGRLALCVGQEDAARHSFASFLRAAEGDPAYTDLTATARRVLTLGRDVESVASEASVQAWQTHQELCAGIAGGSLSLAASSLPAVSLTWERVGTAWEASGHPSLLYWRGLLAQCLGQTGRALDDLEAFLTASSGDPAYRVQVQDSRRRLRRITSDVISLSRADERRILASPERVFVRVLSAVLVGVGGGMLGLGAVADQASLEWQTCMGLNYRCVDPVTGELADAEAQAEKASDRRDIYLPIGATIAGLGAAGISFTLVLPPGTRRAER